MSYPPPPYGPPGGQQQPPMYNYNPNSFPHQPPNQHPMYQQQHPMQGHWQAPQYAYSQQPTINIFYIGCGGVPQYSHSLPPNTSFSFSFGNAAPPQYAAPPNPMYGPPQQQAAAPPYPQQTYPNMPTQAAPPNYAPIYPTQPMPQHPGYADNSGRPAPAARSDGAALPGDGRAFAQRDQDTSRPGVDQLADAVGRDLFIDTPTPSPDSTKATGGVPTDVPQRPDYRGSRSVSRPSSDSESADRRVRPREQAELRKDHRRLLQTADEFRARFPGRTYTAPESSQLHRFTVRQHRRRLIGVDQLGRRYLNATDWETFPENARKEEQREWMERHGFYVCCAECKALRRDCSHTYPCSDCRSNGRQCRLAHTGHGQGICRYGMTCEEPHDEYFAFLDFCLGIPKNTINFWEFPNKLFRQTEHGCQDRNGAPCHVRQMPMRGIALPYSANNPYGYTGGPPRWICEQFRPQAD
ncbi:hypothetical protein KC356_g2825 [Hortaea werneckii]|nr:hypothetical protein KC356_g2825 [Hortaea werneckii]